MEDRFWLTFATSLLAGLTTIRGMVRHEFPEAIVIYALLLRSAFGDCRSATLAFVIATLTTPLGSPSRPARRSMWAPPTSGREQKASRGASASRHSPPAFPSPPELFSPRGDRISRPRHSWGLPRAACRRDPMSGSALAPVFTLLNH
jgi:hypothetical protein